MSPRLAVAEFVRINDRQSLRRKHPGGCQFEEFDPAERRMKSCGKEPVGLRGNKALCAEHFDYARSVEGVSARAVRSRESV